MLKPSLPTSIDEDQVEFYLENPNWIVQQKIDGERAVVSIASGIVKSIGRNGKQRLLPPKLQKTLSLINGDWIFDGEVLDDDYVIFDLLAVPKGTIANLPFTTRYEALSLVLKRASIPHTRLVPTFFTTEDKKDFFLKAKNSKVEGIIFRENSPYIQGRSSNLLKYKFVKTIDCFVIDVKEDEKDNLILGVYNGSDIHRCGKVSALTGDGPSIKQGDVVEVQCLYASPSHKLVQATKPKKRTDKDPIECTIEQIKEIQTNKSLLER